MGIKTLFSFGIAGLLASSVALPHIQAAETTTQGLKVLAEQKIERSSSQSISSTASFRSTSSMVRSSTTDYLLESEPNDDFATADAWSFTKTVKGKLVSWGDEDYYKITVPGDGKLVIKGTSNPNIIDLAFGATEKGWVESSKLVFLENESSYVNGVEVQKYQAKAGTYYVVASDWDYDYGIDDNTSADSYTLQISYTDNVKPAIPTVNKVDSNDLAVTGKAEANSTVTVKNGTATWTAKATTTGTFSVPIAVQKIGTKLTITAKDSAGNTSSSATVTVVDGIAPSKPTVNKVDNNDLKVTGKAEANSTITVKSSTTTFKSIKATSTGTFSVAIPAQKAGTKLSVTAKDSAGNTSSAATVTVVDVIAPSKPTINKVDDNDLKVTGKAEAYSTISVKVGTTSIGTATTNSAGAYSVSIKAQRKGTTLSVTAKDKAGNTSAKSTYIVVAH